MPIPLPHPRWLWLTAALLFHLALFPLRVAAEDARSGIAFLDNRELMQQVSE